jgi:hypothetical protein
MVSARQIGTWICGLSVKIYPQHGHHPVHQLGTQAEEKRHSKVISFLSRSWGSLLPLCTELQALWPLEPWLTSMTLWVLRSLALDWSHTVGFLVQSPLVLDRVMLPAFQSLWRMWDFSASVIVWANFPSNSLSINLSIIYLSIYLSSIYHLSSVSIHLAIYHPSILYLSIIYSSSYHLFIYLLSFYHLSIYILIIYLSIYYHHLSI